MSPSQNETQLDRIEIKLNELLEWKNGNGNSPGVNVRIDRLEQKEESRTFWTRAALGGAASSLLVAIASFLWNKR